MTASASGAVAYGLRVTLGGAAVMAGGSSTTTGRDAPALYASNGTISATDVALSTAGTDNAMQIVITFAPEGDTAGAIRSDILRAIDEQMEIPTPPAHPHLERVLGGPEARDQ